MNVVSFPAPTASGLRFWTSSELQRLVRVYETLAAEGEAFAWDVGNTELDDPQFYILGPAPHCDCLMAVSRVGRIYVLETRTGEVLAEGPLLETVAATAENSARRGAGWLTARLMLALATLRAAIGERLEPVLVESEELLVRVAPQLAMVL
jgi:hypothetical protein